MEEKFEMKSFNAPEEVRTFDNGKVAVVHFGQANIGRSTLEPGWKWSQCVKPKAGTESCESPHFGYQVSGTLKTVMNDGAEKISKAGDIVSIPPGHDSWVEGSEPVVFVDFHEMVNQGPRHEDEEEEDNGKSQKSPESF